MSERIVKRYSNRKLYDTELSRYVTIEEVANHIRDGISVKIVDNKSGEDITGSTLALIVLEAEKKSRNRSSSSVLESVIKTGTLSDFIVRSKDSVKTGLEEAEKWVNQIVDGNRAFWDDTKKYFAKNKDAAKFEDFGERMEEYFKATIEKMRHAANMERAKLEREILALRQQVRELEDKLKVYEDEKSRQLNGE
ncbi:MAG TPA: polyhydroxyalkanoate synthesis regulator DNA-binding domain-containing protein [bacterium]|nr:polyhydroxyalkanoate synthesis regulator DNA-binding domain-containing protein [bacterium]